MRIPIGKFVSYFYQGSFALIEDKLNQIIYKGPINHVSNTRGFCICLEPVMIARGEIEFHNGAYRTLQRAAVSFDGLWEIQSNYAALIAKDFLAFCDHDCGLVEISSPSLTILCYPGPFH